MIMINKTQFLKTLKIRIDLDVSKSGIIVSRIVVVMMLIKRIKKQIFQEIFLVLLSILLSE